MSSSERLTALCQEFCSGVTSQNVPKILAKGSIRAEVYTCKPCMHMHAMYQVVYVRM